MSLNVVSNPDDVVDIKYIQKEIIVCSCTTVVDNRSITCEVWYATKISRLI